MGISTMTIATLDTFRLYLMLRENDEHHICSFGPKKVNVNVEMRISFGASYCLGWSVGQGVKCSQNLTWFLVEAILSKV